LARLACGEELNDRITTNDIGAPPVLMVVRKIRRHVLRWGRANFQSYAWRHEKDPWRSLLAEVLLQRTRARQVEPVFLALSRRFPTAESLASAEDGVVRSITRNLGLHKRGRQLVDIAIAVAKRGGQPPEDLTDLQRYKGVGAYTASAWLSLHRGKRAVMVDANVARWLSRVVGRPQPRDPRNVAWINDLADVLTPRRAFRDYNYGVLDLTMEVCITRQPRCDACPLRTECSYASMYN